MVVLRVAGSYSLLVLSRTYTLAKLCTHEIILFADFFFFELLTAKLGVQLLHGGGPYTSVHSNVQLW